MEYRYRKPLEEITRKGFDHSKVFSTFVHLGAIALERMPWSSEAPREAEYMAEEIERWPSDVPPLFAHAFGDLVTEMEQHPFTDILGDTHLEWGAKSRRDALGEFYTPRDVSKSMAKMLLPTDPALLPADRPLTVLEPACGAGGMILAVAEVIHELGVSVRCLRVQGWDISKTAIDMSLINTTLWAIPFEAVHGNPLSMEVFNTFRNPWFHMAHGFVGGALTNDCDPVEGSPPEAPYMTIPARENLQGCLFEDLP